MGLTESSGDDQVRVVGEQQRRVSDALVGHEFRVGLVKHNQTGRRDGVQKGDDLVSADHSAGRIVRIGNKCKLGVGIDRRCE